ncbi:hypothetical protein [Aquicoccus sp. SU-CL01552]|uniref:hypothetical protein n=1 Tax=Aquicoccus sp. SU-CL01552 TaxID=3127656 RepID=UPI003108E11C
MGNRDETTRSLRDRLRQVLERIRARVPRGLRFVLGLLMILGGVFGFLPVLGFWMVPLGIMVAGQDVRLFLRWWRQKRNQR